MFERISLKLGELLTGLKREEGQGATEYAMVIAFIVVTLGLGLSLMGASIEGFLDGVAGEIDALI